MDAFDALAADVERAEGPDRLLDCRIWLLVGAVLGQPFSLRGKDPIAPGEIVQGRWFGSALEKYPDDAEGVARNWRVPRFTASTDAALSLLTDIGYVVWAPVGKRPSCITHAADAWIAHSQGFNEASAMTAAALRAWPKRAGQDHKDIGA